jgi:hypothetical protein
MSHPPKEEEPPPPSGPTEKDESWEDDLQKAFLKKQAAWIETVAAAKMLPQSELDKIEARFHVANLELLPEEEWADATKMINYVLEGVQSDD